jgi:hypothetical protein
MFLVAGEEVIVSVFQVPIVLFPKAGDCLCVLGA